MTVTFAEISGDAIENLLHVGRKKGRKREAFFAFYRMTKATKRHVKSSAQIGGTLGCVISFIVAAMMSGTPRGMFNRAEVVHPGV